MLDPSAQQVPSDYTGAAPQPGAGTTTVPPTPTGTSAPPTSSGGSAPTTPTPVDTAYRVAGGQVGCRCTGDRIALNGAWPDDGWSVKSSTSDGGSRLRVEFESGSQRTRVEATCSGGRPVVSVEDDSSGGGGDDGGGAAGGGDDD